MMGKGSDTAVPMHATSSSPPPQPPPPPTSTSNGMAAEESWRPKRRPLFDPDKVAALKASLSGQSIEELPPKPTNVVSSSGVMGPGGILDVTSSGRNRGLGKANEPKFDCQVCGDMAAGFHCGAYVCEACKKFYLRCLKSRTLEYQCPKTKQCEISKDTRSHCQFCRFQKCMQLGMYKPGRQDSRQLRVDFKAISCKVCGSASSGFHFGAITCEGCKGFFRRMVKENLHRKFMCSSNGSCDVTTGNRTACKQCRYNKCLQVGMALEGTRLGRQSNSIKRNTLLHYQRTGQDVALIKDEEVRSKFSGNFLSAPTVAIDTTVIKKEKEDEGYFESGDVTSPLSLDVEQSHLEPLQRIGDTLMERYAEVQAAKNDENRVLNNGNKRSMSPNESSQWQQDAEPMRTLKHREEAVHPAYRHLENNPNHPSLDPQERHFLKMQQKIQDERREFDRTVDMAAYQAERSGRDPGNIVGVFDSLQAMYQQNNGAVTRDKERRNEGEHMYNNREHMQNNGEHMQNNGEHMQNNGEHMHNNGGRHERMQNNGERNERMQNNGERNERMQNNGERNERIQKSSPKELSRGSLHRPFLDPPFDPANDQHPHDPREFQRFNPQLQPEEAAADLAFMEHCRRSVEIAMRRNTTKEHDENNTIPFSNSLNVIPPGFNNHGANVYERLSPNNTITTSAASSNFPHKAATLLPLRFRQPANVFPAPLSSPLLQPPVHHSQFVQRTDSTQSPLPSPVHQHPTQSFVSPLASPNIVPPQSPHESRVMVSPPIQNPLPTSSYNPSTSGSLHSPAISSPPTAPSNYPSPPPPTSVAVPPPLISASDDPHLVPSCRPLPSPSPKASNIKSDNKRLASVLLAPSADSADKKESVSRQNSQEDCRSPNSPLCSPFVSPASSNRYYLQDKRKMALQELEPIRIDYSLPTLSAHDPRTEKKKRSRDDDDDDSEKEEEKDSEEEEGRRQEVVEDENPMMSLYVDYAGVTRQLLEAYQELHHIMTRPPQMDQLDLSTNDASSAWRVAYMSFAHHTKFIIRFIKKIPGFPSLGVQDQIALVRDGIYPITLLYHSFYYDLETGEHHWFVHTPEERDYILKWFPMFKGLSQHIQFTGFVFKSFNLNPMELAYLCAISIFSIDIVLVQAKKEVLAIQECLTDAFIQSSQDEVNTDPARAGILLLRLSELKRANIEHSHIARLAQEATPDMDFGQLWREIFLKFGF